MYVPFCGQSVTWMVVYLLIQFSESLICWWGSDLYMQSPGALAFINTFVLLSWISLPNTFGFPEASLFIPLAKSWRFWYHMLSCPSLPASRANWQEHNAKRNGFTPPSRDQSPSNLRKRFLSEFWLLPAIAAASTTTAKRLLRSWHEREWALGVPFSTPWAHSRGLLVGCVLSASLRAQLWISGDTAFRLKATRGEKWWFWSSSIHLPLIPFQSPHTVLHALCPSFLLISVGEVVEWAYSTLSRAGIPSAGF